MTANTKGRYGVDYTQPLEKFSKSESQFMEMETKAIARQLATFHASKGGNFILAIGMHLRDQGREMLARQKTSDTPEVVEPKKPRVFER